MCCAVPQVDDRYDNLSNKTRHFFRDVYLEYPSLEFIVKVGGSGGAPCRLMWDIRSKRTQACAGQCMLFQNVII